MVKKVYKLTCDDCDEFIYVNGADQAAAFKKARLNGWAVGRDKKRCYCPTHAPAHRYDPTKGGTIV